MKYFLICTLFLFVTFSAQAQKKSKSEKKKSRTEQAERDNSFAPFSPAQSAVENQPKAEKSRKASKKNKSESFAQVFNRNMDQKKLEFEQRMKQNAKDNRKEARIMKKPQYSDPLYFGHKKKPKKRPAGKRKLCKECGIVH
ncbi:hypothetical protein [Fulvivirga sedimenti]|uniref:Uncharacterized protein n=1 Tax=Fulvivirga sedimenti TaxID=2879465 RepID=A0A9X1KZ94_9BACT|nr:hypothetical protein [Fulvivirga sedimenti]MCA6074446.1 hypothetical protein [Fulvivirga sedimenti]